MPFRQVGKATDFGSVSTLVRVQQGQYADVVELVDTSVLGADALRVGSTPTIGIMDASGDIQGASSNASVRYKIRSAFPFTHGTNWSH